MAENEVHLDEGEDHGSYVLGGEDSLKIRGVTSRIAILRPKLPFDG